MKETRVTPSQPIGPFYHFALTADPGMGRMVSPGESDAIRLLVRVLDREGGPVNAMVELWQVELWQVELWKVELWQVDPGGRGRFGRLATDAAGECTFETVMAPSISVSVFAPGLTKRAVTRIYFHLDEADPVLTLVPAERRETLLAKLSGDVWEFEIHLSGPRETVFFDV